MAIGQNGQGGDILTTENVVGVAQAATNLVGSANPVVGALSVGLTGISSNIASEKRAKEIADMFGNGDVRIAKQSPVVRHELANLDKRWQGSMLEAALIIMGGAAAGMLLGPIIGGIFGTLAIPIPFFGTITGSAIGFFIGSIAGGMVASKIYNGFGEKQAQDPLVINEQIVKMQASGQAVPPELVFAALAANVSGKSGERIDKMLKKYTGTECFTEALCDPKKIEKIAALMNDPSIGNAIRAQTQMPHDVNNPRKPVAVQYAELINSGQLNPRRLLNVGAGLYSLPPSPMIHNVSNGVNMSPEVPQTPMRTQAQVRET